MQVKNILGHRNQFMIIDDNGTVHFQSYNTHMAKVTAMDGPELLQLRMMSNYWSVTTAKHFKAFLEDNRLWLAVQELIDHKVFCNLKDFMQRVDIMQVSRFRIYVEYVNKDGYIDSYKLKLTE